MLRYGLALLIVASPFSALAGELPKEGNSTSRPAIPALTTRLHSPRPTPHQVLN
jgi:hypothetical protein